MATSLNVRVGAMRAKKEKILSLILGLLSFSCAINSKHPSAKLKPENKEKRQKRYNFAKDVVKDAVILHKNLFSFDSFKIAATTFPFFVAGRMVDEELQRCFYNRKHHKNILQMHRSCEIFSKYAVAIPSAIFGLMMLKTDDEDFWETTRIFLIGMPFVIYEKNLLKKLKFGSCKRPRNEHFSCKERSDGGFPSGHLAEAVYATTLYGMRHGLRFGVPLGIMSFFIAVDFINCNRHYLSQLIAGAGLGAMFAVSASKIVDSKLAKNVNIDASINERGAPELKIAYRF